MDSVPTQRFNFTLEGREYKLDVGADLDITPSTFNACLMRHPALLGFYAGLYRTADRVVNKIQDDFDIWSSICRNAIRLANSAAKLTEKAIDDLLRCNVEYRERKERLTEAEYTRDMLLSITYALRDRTSMLMKMGAKVREGQDLEYHGSEELTVRDVENQRKEWEKTRQNTTATRSESQQTRYSSKFKRNS